MYLNIASNFPRTRCEAPGKGLPRARSLQCLHGLAPEAAPRACLHSCPLRGPLARQTPPHPPSITTPPLPPPPAPRLHAAAPLSWDLLQPPTHPDSGHDSGHDSGPDSGVPFHDPNSQAPSEGCASGHDVRGTEHEPTHSGPESGQQPASPTSEEGTELSGRTQAQCRQLQRALESGQGVLESTQRELEAARRELESSQEALESAQRALECSQQEALRAAGEASELRGEVQEAGQQVTVLQERVEEAEKEVGALRQRLGAAELRAAGESVRPNRS